MAFSVEAGVLGGDGHSTMYGCSMILVLYVWPAKLVKNPSFYDDSARRRAPNGWLLAVKDILLTYTLPHYNSERGVRMAPWPKS